MKRINKLFSILFAFVLIMIQPVSIYAANADNLSEGTYNISASLSCYVNAMGGVEFGKPLLKSAQLIVDKNGSKKIKLNLTKASVTIYSVTCDTFVDASPTGTAQESDSKVSNGTIGYYDKNGKLNTSDITHTISSDTALNSQNEAVKYVDSITFPINSVSNTYKLTLFVNSNVMGMQFDPATLTVDWSSVKPSGKNNHSKAKADSAAEKTAKTSQNTDSSDQNKSKNINISESAAATGSQTTNSAAGQNEITSQTANGNGNADTSDNVIQKDGLDIHYVNGDSKLALGDDNDSDIPFYVYLNMPVLIGMAIFAGVLIIAGTVLLVVSKKQKEKKSNE